MKHPIVIFLFSWSLLLGKFSIAQEVLPEFKLKLISPGKVLISWYNTHQNCVKLNVQRSSDNKKFETIVSAKKPGLYENSYTDTKLTKDKNAYYRIQYTIKGGLIYFSNTHSIQEKKINKNTASTINNSNWKASPFVFTNINGYIQILINNPSEYVYSVKFKDEKGNDLFQIKKIETADLILDKTNFIHSGWFQFELYKDDVLLEKNKVFLKGN
jgi:hypothetical protein